MSTTEKTMFQSKKFSMCVLSLMLLFSMFTTLVLMNPDTLPTSTIMLAIVVVFGFISATYIGGVAALDRYIHLDIFNNKG